MGDIILAPVAELIIETLGSAAVEKIKSVSCARAELTKLESTLSTIRAVLADAEKRQIREEQVRDWLQKLEDVLFDADDLVDEVNAEGLRRQLLPGKKVRKKVRTFFSSDNQLVFRHKMASRIKDIQERLDAISADKERFHFVALRDEIQPARRVRDDSHSFVDEKTVVGRDKDRKAILEFLLGPESRAHQEKVSVIPIVGMGGLGKTTLAQLVFNDERVQKHFDLKAWVCVSDDFRVKVLCEKIIKITTGEKIEDLEMEQVQIKLREKIEGKRFLLVLDDVWSEEGQKWKELKNLLIASCSKGSRIIITTRLQTVADVMGTVQPYDLGILDLEDAWNLFKTMAAREGQEISNPMGKIARGILEKCAGLPLAISMIGGTLLRSRKPEIDWPSLLENEPSNITQKERGILSTLKLSYDYAPSHLKPCFAYCSLFPKDYEFDVQTLIALWIAQGFIKPCQSQSLEEIGYEYFRDLLWRSFFQDAKKGELNMVKTCKMHDLVHDLAIQVAGEKYAMLASCEEKTLGKSARHVSLDFNSLSRASQLEKALSSWLQAPRLRSFLLPSGRHLFGFARGLAWDEVISNIKFLRMLDLHDVGIEEVPSSISKLKHLRYLDLSENEIRTLPASITKLVNLQTLKLNYCRELHKLPSEIHRLVNLRHLDLEGCESITHMPRGLGQLTNLQTLALFVVGENILNRPCLKLDELIGLNNLRGKLEIKGIKSGMASTATELIKKNHLQSLSLNFEHNIDEASYSEQEWKMTLEGLQPHPNIRELNLAGYGGSSLSSLLPTLTNLVKLEIGGCSKCQQLPSFDRFHSLKEMYISDFPSLEYITINEGDSFFSTSYSATASVLPSLQELRLRELPNFRGWWRSDMAENQVDQVIFSSFPCLSSLTILNCPELTFMPCYPNVKGELYLRNTSWKHFERTMLMRVVPQAQTSTTTTAAAEQALASSAASSSITCSNTTSYYLFCKKNTTSYYPLSKLTSLYLFSIIDLQYLPKDRLKCLASLKKLSIWYCPLKCLPPGIQHLTSLDSLEIEGCEEFVAIEWPKTPSLTSLRKLRLRGLPKLKHLLSPAIQYLTSLQQLSIWCCEELQLSNDDSIAWQALTSLRFLQFGDLPQLVTLPRGLQFVTTLEDLQILECDNFTALPNWICKLSSLQRLPISRCPNFKSVPGSISSLTSLQYLQINDETKNPREIREDLNMS